MSATLEIADDGGSDAVIINSLDIGKDVVVRIRTHLEEVCMADTRLKFHPSSSQLSPFPTEL